MGTLSGPPSLEIIKKLAGVIDFYCWKGKWCFRKWPRYVKPRMPGQIAGNIKFTKAVHSYNELTDDERIYWRKLAVGTKLSGRDLFIKNYILTS